MSFPVLISIITPCLNRAGFVTEAVESAQQQDYPCMEHIVTDGGSTDGTLEALARYPHVRVSSEPDEGVYDALNKGVRLARGDVIGFLNTDDLYEPFIFGTVAQAFLNNPEVDAVVGGASIFRSNAHGERTNLAMFGCVPQKELLVRSTQGAPIFNAWFFRKRLFEELGVFDCRYRYVADREFLIRMASWNRSYVGVDQVFYHYRMHPGSYTLSGQDSGEAGYMFECRALAERYLHLKGISPKALKCFKSWHSQITMEQIMTAWRKRAFRRAVEYVLIGLRYDLRWPKAFVSTALEQFSTRSTR